MHSLATYFPSHSPRPFKDIDEAAGGLQKIRVALDELLWPTRCVLCDMPGYIMCPTCAYSLPYIDFYATCPTCSEPYAYIQCTRCGRSKETDAEKPFYCIGCLFLEKRSLKIVRTFKDSGEQRISSFMALVFYEYTKHIEDLAAITYIPARASAYRKRGFDHMALVAHKLSLLFQIPVVQTLFSKEQQDQRALSRKQRQANAQYMFEARADAEGFYDKHILLIDDVFTTGATLYNAQKCLEDQGFTQVTCAVFARS